MIRIQYTIDCVFIDRILNENKTVYQLYKDLVISGLVPADDFWSKYVDVCNFMINISMIKFLKF
jgi:hypothetical protein